MILLAPPALIRVTPLQPMRYLHLVYLFLALIGGCLLGRHIPGPTHRPLGRLPGSRQWRNVSLPAPDVPEFESSRVPGREPANPWLQAFTWIRGNTPKDAYFALDPNYLALPGEDYHSFRALAERSQLADAIKDTAVVTQVPQLGPAWAKQVDAQAGWDRFQFADFARLRAQFGVGWVLVSYPPPARLTCIWHNDRLSVCRIDDSSQGHSF